MSGISVYAPGAVPLEGKKGRKCITCDHWKRREADPKWRFAAECPCYECAGYGYSVFDDLEFWTPILYETT